MIALVRRISAYTGNDVLLGLFCSRSEAAEARAMYLQIRQADPAADPWNKQAYNSGMPIDENLVLEELPGAFSDGDIAHVVCLCLEFLGQSSLELDSVHAGEAAAKARMGELQATPQEFPHYALVDTLRVGVLHSDLREDQPGLRRASDEWRPRSLFPHLGPVDRERHDRGEQSGPMP